MSSVVDITNFKIAYQFLSEAILLCDQHGLVRYANPAFLHAFPDTLPPDQDTPFSDLLHGRREADNSDKAFGIASREGQWNGDLVFALGQEDFTQRHVQVDTLFNEHKEVQFFVARVAEVSADAKQNEVLQELAYRDELTGLANRALFNQLFEHEISLSQRQQSKFALLFIDLDKFKHVNDSLGHDAGDYLLCSLAERLQKSLRKSDVVARYGGDEFVVIMGNIKDSETVANVAEKVIRQIRKPVKYGAHLLEVGCSIGISIFPDNGTDTEHLLHHADVAMYRAKQQGGLNYFYFSEELNRELQDNRHMEELMGNGLQNREFVPYFQPLLDQRNGQLVGIECLARWLHPHKGMMSPLEFLPVAKKLGMIQPILNQVLEGAFDNLRQWYQDFQCQVPLSVNLTGNQFFQQHTFDELKRLLAEHQLQPQALRIEIAESALQDQGEDLVDRLKSVRDAGFSITLDDFGTGYSSLRYLQRLPVDIIKIDRSFVRNMENNPHDKVIVKAIIQLAQTLGIEAVAEGVETLSQKGFLQENHCHIMQGFLFSPALSAEDFATYLTRSQLQSAV